MPPYQIIQTNILPMNNSDNKILRQYSIEYGFFIGISWFLLFYNYVQTIEQGSVIHTLGVLLMIVVSLILPLFLGVRINRKTTMAGFTMSYRQAFSFSLLMFFFASVLHTAGVYAFLEFVDKGDLFSTLSSMLSMPEIKSTYESLGLSTEYAQAIDTMKEVEKAGTANLAINFFIYDCFIGFIGSIFTSGMASHKWKRDRE